MKTYMYNYDVAKDYVLYTYNGQKLLAQGGHYIRSALYIYIQIYIYIRILMKAVISRN